MCWCNSFQRLGTATDTEEENRGHAGKSFAEMSDIRLDAVSLGSLSIEGTSRKKTG